MKRILRNIKARYSLPGVWWHDLVIIGIVAIMFILGWCMVLPIRDSALLALVFVTLLYVMVMKEIFYETRRQRLSASQAVMWPVILWKGQEDFAELTLNNIGNAPAINVKVFLQDDLIYADPSYFTAQGEGAVLRCLDLPSPVEQTALGAIGRVVNEGFLKRLASLEGKYQLVVNWDDLLEQHFEARLLFNLWVDSSSEFNIKHGIMSLTYLEGPKLGIVKRHPDGIGRNKKGG